MCVTVCVSLRVLLCHCVCGAATSFKKKKKKKRKKKKKKKSVCVYNVGTVKRVQKKLKNDEKLCQKVKATAKKEKTPLRAMTLLFLGLLLWAGFCEKGENEQ